MLREFRPSDVGPFFPLFEQHFPEESRVLGMDPEAFQRIAHRIYRWDARLVLGLARLFGRPVFRFFVIEERSRLVATTLLTYTANAGYVSMVMVDTPFRRRGFAQRMLGACAQAARRSRKGYIVLDVLTSNAPARALYAKTGFQRLRGDSHLRWDRPSGGRLTPQGPVAGSRPLRRSDATQLVELVRREIPPAVATVLPPERGHFLLPPLVTTGLESETEAWVLDDGAGPRMFVRGTASRAMAAGHLTGPIVAPEVPTDRAAQLVGQALDWLAGRGVPRVLAEVADHNPRGLAALQAAGFVPDAALATETMYRRLDA
jgi:ribosomal protein S18 acetylase RimI-like enzyme